MAGNSTDKMQDQLVLRSQLSEINQVPVWIERLSTKFGIPEKIQFAIDVCLEEVVSNVIRHGYAGMEGHSLVVRFSMPRSNYLEFVVEDEAPHFNPLEAPALQPLSSGEEMRVGGQGIRFLRELSDAIEYEPTPVGNRLTIGFSTVPAK